MIKIYSNTSKEEIDRLITEATNLVLTRNQTYAYIYLNDTYYIQSTHIDDWGDFSYKDDENVVYYCLGCKNLLLETIKLSLDEKFDLLK